MIFSASTFRAPAFRQLALASAISATFVSPVRAQTDDNKTLAPVVVTAARIEQSQAEALPHTTVITQKMIRERQVSDVATLLRTEAGIEIAQTGGAGSVTSLFMRGTNANQSLILIDGIPVRDATQLGTSVALQNIHPDQIERIEIVRGNVSAIYGSGAIGGVIQIFTKVGTGQPVVNLSAEIGSRGTTKISGGVTGQSGGTRYMLSATRLKTDGFSAMNTRQYPNENPDKDGDRNVSMAAAVSHEWSKGNELGARFYANDARFSFDGGGWGSPTQQDEGKLKQHTLAVFSKNRLSASWMSTVTVSNTETRREYETRNVGEYGYKSYSNLLQWNNEVMLSPNWMMTAGADVGRENAGALFGGALDRSRSTSSVHAGLNGKFDAHSIQANVRSDHVGNVGSDTTGYLGYGYALTKEWKLIASASTAFLAPNMYQLYDSYSGNPNLKAERARSKEIGVQYAAGRTMIRATLFETHTSDLIDYVSTGGWTGEYRNIDRARNQGVELSANSRIVGMDVHASLTFQNPENDKTGEQLSRRAKTLGSFGLSKSLGQLTLGGDMQYQAHRPDGTSNLPSYYLVNLNARYQIGKNASLYARVENLFDREYQTAYGYNQTPRGVFAGIEWRQ